MDNHPRTVLVAGSELMENEPAVVGVRKNGDVPIDSKKIVDFGLSDI